MTVESSSPTPEPTDPRRRTSAPPDRDQALMLRYLADEDLFWDTLEAKEEELHHFLRKSDVSLQERQAAQADLDSVGWLFERWDDVLHNARCLKDFDNWLRTPASRERLFAEYCRHAVPEEWDRFLEEHEPPFIFPTRRKFDAHLDHCQLCDMQIQLAQGRRRAVEGRRAWGDQIVLDFLTTFCGEALAAICDPELRRRGGPAGPRRVWSETPRWRLTIPADIRPVVREGRLKVPARLVGPAYPLPFELVVTAQFLPQSSRHPEAPQVVYPAHSGDDARIDWRPNREGWADFPLMLPPPSEPGRLILRYAVRTPPPTVKGKPAPAARSETTVSAATVDVPEA